MPPSPSSSGSGSGSGNSRTSPPPSTLPSKRPHPDPHYARPHYGSPATNLFLTSPGGGPLFTNPNNNGVVYGGDSVETMLDGNFLQDPWVTETFVAGGEALDPDLFMAGGSALGPEAAHAALDAALGEPLTLEKGRLAT